jgi:GNAT superfamily N-acetyltransferase
MEAWYPLIPEPVLEPMTRGDVAEVKALIADGVLELYSDLDFLPKNRQSLLDYYDGTGYLSDVDGFETEYAPGNGVFLVIRGVEGIQGCGGLRRHGGEQGELVRLWLRKESRGRGLGAMILGELLRRSAEIGYREILLDTSHRCVAAISLFRKNGFAECPKYKESIADVYMHRRIEPSGKG